MRRYAEGTRVGISRSRDQIGNLLRTWGAAGVQWTDEYAPDIKVTLRFKWKFEETELLARFTMVCDIKHIEEDSIDGRTGGLSEAKFDKNMAAWQGEAHRLLFLFLKGAMYAVEAGLIKAEQVFMPFFEDSSGQTIGEILGTRLSELPRLSAMKLLTAGR